MNTPIRVGFDLDGVVADFATAYRDVERRLFGEGASGRPGEPEREEASQKSRETALLREASDPPGETPAEVHLPTEMRRRSDLIWKEIQGTTDFWVTLRPLEDGTVRRIHQLMLRDRWEVFFITQRPETAGDTVQRQSQRWLAEQGFDLPSVVVLSGSRGAAAAALGLSYHVDDNPQNCIDVRSQSSARPLLMAPEDDAVMVSSARKLGIGVAPTLSACLDILEQASAAESQPALLERLAALVGWR